MHQLKVVVKERMDGVALVSQRPGACSVILADPFLFVVAFDSYEMILAVC
jgi:hypothetical protein